MIIRSLVLFVLLLSTLIGVEKPDLILAKKYNDAADPTGWLMSEKLDGIRAYWDGKHLISRNGHRFTPPASFTENFPPFPLDGELWTKRSDFEQIGSIVKDSVPTQEWRIISYNLFEVPEAEGFFLQRLEKAKLWFEAHPNPHIQFVEQIPCESKKHLEEALKSVERRGGEGLMLRNPDALYETGRSDNLLKVKSYEDMEGNVIGYKAGEGKFKGLVGSLQIKLDNGIRFYLGSGLSMHERENPPKIGTLITFKYYGLTKNGKPRFPSFLRIREIE